ncbi:MAG: response regulator transcription factor [Cyclobacteriaceae bacterium]|nr:response regulator transcription factor [Cyclobacteriaceae bacterium]
MSILVIEDDITLNKNIKTALSAENFIVESIFDGLLAERMLKKDNFDCVIMDVNLPGKTGFDLCRNFRNFNTKTPVLMLTAFSELDDKIKGFECGADDYLTKPFLMRELILRVNALIKRSRNHNPKENTQIIAGDIIINQSAKKVIRQGQEISLTPREYQILIKLCKSSGEIISKGELMKEIWGKTMDANTNTIEVYISFLRNKLDKPFNKNSIRTKIGYGYYLNVE